MKTKLDHETQRRLVRQWGKTGEWLEEVKRKELAALTDAEAWRQTEALLSLAPHYRRRRRTSGLVQQQAWFHRLPHRRK
ncbi:MAG: hypothetical protein HY301_07380 [Verrucomicrobia bacterium]|nr:hypothetical protein [Verrucomicrobiota bacterium]